MDRTYLLRAMGVFVLTCGVLHANPIPVPSLLMPEEYIDVMIGEQLGGLQAAVDGRYPFQNIGHQAVKMLYPVAPASSNIGVWLDGTPLQWWWSRQTYPTILPEWPWLPMIEWSIAPVPDQFEVAAHYEHSIIRRPNEWVFLYPMGTGKYLSTYAKETTAHVAVRYPDRYVAKGVFRDREPVAFSANLGNVGWLLQAEVQSRPFEPLLEDFILTMIDRWADPRSWFSLPPDMASGRDLISSVEANCLPMADDFAFEGLSNSLVPPVIRNVQWWGSFPGWQVQEAHPDLTHAPRPAYFIIRIYADGGGKPGQLLYQQQVDQFNQTYFGSVVRRLPDTTNENTYEYEHEFEYRVWLSKPFQVAVNQRYWLSICAGPVAGEYAWGWATSAIPWGAPAWPNGCGGTSAQERAASPAAAPAEQREAPLVYCDGTESGGHGPRRYAYPVDSVSYPMIDFRVGTNDLDASHYTNVLTPEGWQFAVEDRTMGHLHGTKTPHGQVSPGPCRCLTRGSVHWWTTDATKAVEVFTFGFDHPWVSEDVSWQLTTQRPGPPPQTYTFHEWWSTPVGTGMGPLHGPYTSPRYDMAFALSSGPPARVRYRLLEGSTLTDDCTICGRPPISVPIRGSFWLAPSGQDMWYTTYTVGNFTFKSEGSSIPYTGRARGTYKIGGDFAFTHQMKLEGRINNLDHLSFDSGVQFPKLPFPWIEIDLDQVPPTDPLHTFSFHLVAVPWSDLWFSTEVGFHPSSSSAGGYVSDGDLLNSNGRIVRTNAQLVQRLGIMPPPPDIGLDAVVLPMIQPAAVANASRPTVWFSPEEDVWSERLGQLGQGDLLSDAGAIVRRNRDLIAPFSPEPGPHDYGLDAVTMDPDGRLLFSTEESFFSERLGVMIGHGDLLSEDGQIVRTSAQLMSGFHPMEPGPIDFGLDAAHLFPHGEVWFSIEVDFMDQFLGPIHHGDVLSSIGRVVWRNRELLAPFGPIEDLADFGLDAMQVVWPPQIMSAISRKTHGGTAYDVDLLNPGANADPVAECRAGGPAMVTVTFDQPIYGRDGLDAGDIAISTSTSNFASVASLAIDANELSAAVSNTSSAAPLVISFPGIEDEDGNVAAEALSFGVLAGDVNADKTVNTLDLVMIRNQLNQAVDADNFRDDVNADGAINVLDLVAVRNNLNAKVDTWP